jgi:hypothetical protein
VCAAGRKHGLQFRRIRDLHASFVMFDSLISKVVLGWIRHFIGMGAALLVAHGYWTSSQGDQALGAIMALVPLAFSAYDKWHALQVKNTALLNLAQASQAQQLSATQQVKS